MGNAVLHAAGLGRGEAEAKPGTEDLIPFTWQGPMPWTLKEKQDEQPGCNL